RGPRPPLPRRALLRLPLAVRGVRAADRRGDGLRRPGGDEPWRGDGGDRGRRGRARRPVRRRVDRGRDRGGVGTPRRAHGQGPRAGGGVQLAGDRRADGGRLPGGRRGMTAPLVVLDADVLGRERTGDETYVASLLRHLPALAAGELRFAALTRRPDLVPSGVEPVHVTARLQELRMLVSVPHALGRLRPALAHFQHALPARCPCPAVVTVHDLSFERDASLMPVLDRLVFRFAVPRAVRRAVRVLAVSERTKADLVELYSVDPAKIVVTPHGVDPVFSPGAGNGGGYALFVGAIQRRKDPLAAAEAAAAVGLPLVA